MLVSPELRNSSYNMYVCMYVCLYPSLIVHTTEAIWKKSASNIYFVIQLSVLSSVIRTVQALSREHFVKSIFV